LRLGALMAAAAAVQLVFSLAALFIGVKIATEVAQTLRRAVFRRVHGDGRNPDHRRANAERPVISLGSNTGC
jgi:hypothetical protein